MQKISVALAAIAGQALALKLRAQEHACGNDAPSTFDFVTDKKSWQDAEDHCVANGGHLASVNSMEDQTEVYGLTTDYENQPVWLGMNNLENEDKWVWSDGSPTDFVYWDEGQPQQNDERCMMIHWQSRQEWHDGGCGGAKAFVCEYKVCDQPPAPEPESDYYILKDAGKMPFVEAANACIASGGALASFTSAEEKNEAVRVAKENREDEQHWIGLTDRQTEGKWEFIDCTPLEYSFWRPNEPNDWNGQDCGWFQVNQQNGKWDDAGCEQNRWPLCRKARAENWGCNYSVNTPYF